MSSICGCVVAVGCIVWCESRFGLAKDLARTEDCSLFWSGTYRVDTSVNEVGGGHFLCTHNVLAQAYDESSRPPLLPYADHIHHFTFIPADQSLRLAFHGNIAKGMRRCASLVSTWRPRTDTPACPYGGTAHGPQGSAKPASLDIKKFSLCMGHMAQPMGHSLTGLS